MATTIVPFRSPSGQATSRRALLQGAADLGAMVALGVPAALAGESADPHPAWYAEWKANLDWCNAPGSTGGRDLVEFPQWQRAEELEELIGTTPATTLAGASAQLRLMRYWCTPDSMPNETLDAALENALATVERLAGEAVHG